MSLIDPKHCWVVMVDTPDGGQMVALLPAEIFDIEAALNLREQVGERAVISLIGAESIAYCAATGDLKDQLEAWLDIELDDPANQADEAVE